MTESVDQVTFEDIVVGTGQEASKGALCFITYDGYLEDGTLFDSTSRHGRPFEFVVGSNKVIKGLSLGVAGMREGGKRKIQIPSSLAYGERQVGAHIKPHSNLIFELELIEARPRE